MASGCRNYQPLVITLAAIRGKAVQHHRSGYLNALVNGLTLLLTIFVALALGIYAGYALLMAVLRLMGHRTEPTQRTPIFVTSEAHSGD